MVDLNSARIPSPTTQSSHFTVSPETKKFQRLADATHGDRLCLSISPRQRRACPVLLHTRRGTEYNRALSPAKSACYETRDATGKPGHEAKAGHGQNMEMTRHGGEATKLGPGAAQTKEAFNPERTGQARSKERGGPSRRGRHGTHQEMQRTLHFVSFESHYRMLGIR